MRSECIASKLYPIFQVDGFKYECGLGGQRLETSLNVSEGTVSCGISEGVNVYLY